MGFESAFVRVFDGNPEQGGVFKGTAFFIRPQQLLTARHVVDMCMNGVFLRMPDGGMLLIPPAQIERFERDIATLHTPLSFDVFPIMLATLPPTFEDAVKLCGFFDAQQSLHQRPSNISGYVNVQHTWNIADGVKPGMSGGAVMREGELVGIIQARDEESKIITYCIPIDEIRACLGEVLEDLDRATDHNPELLRAATVFVGRQDELAHLKAALLGDSRSPVAITALHGMAGVGKSWLADHFFATHRQHFPGGYQRLVLNAENPSSADLLLADLTERLQIAVPKQALPRHLQARLQQPRTLVHLENVDSDAAATVAAQFCQVLPGCAVVLSGRLDNFGASQHWQQVSLKPFLRADARAQLLAELAWINDTVIAEDDANKLVQVLGGLPLAIHLAAGYLAAGYSVDEFLHELHATGFDLPPEDATDGLYTRDQARAVLHSTFQLSLRLLAEQSSKRRITDAHQVFTCLGFAPVTGFGLSMAAALTAQDEGACRSLLHLAKKLSLIELTQPQPPRWVLHPLLADYLRQQTSDSGCQERLHRWFMQRLPEPSTTEEGAPPDYRAWHELNTEHAALSEWLISINSEQHTTVECAGSQYALRNGPFAHWMVFCQQALINTSMNDEQRSNLLFTLAYVAQSSGNMDTALQTAEAKYQLDHARGNEREATLAKGKIADILQARGQLDEALRIRTEDQLPVLERLGEVRSIAITKGKIADILQARGQLDEALRIRTEDQLPVLERLGEVRSIAITKGKIADILQARGQLDEALRIRTEDQLPVLERLGEVRSIAITKGKIADILFLQHQQSEAIEIYEKDIFPVYEYLGDKQALLVGQANLAMMYLQTGENSERANQLLCCALQSALHMQIPEAGQIEAILQHFNMTCDER